MSDKQLALNSIERLPADASLEDIAERMEFLAALRKGLNQIEQGETLSHEEVKHQLAIWNGALPKPRPGRRNIRTPEA